MISEITTGDCSRALVPPSCFRAADLQLTMTKGDAIDLSAGTSNVLWEVRLLWNSRKHETHSFYWSDDVDAVTREALGVWDSLGDNPEYRDTMDNVDGTKTRPGAPYQGFSCLNAGSSCLHISVAALKQQRGPG